MKQGALWWTSRTPRWAVALVVIASVGGCTARGQAPSPTAPMASARRAVMPPTTAAPSPPRPTEPAKPTGWTRGGDDDAVAAARYFLDLYNYVRATGDLTEWDALSDPGCEFCANTHTRVAEVYQAGGRLDGGTVAVSDGALIDYTPELHVHSVQFAYTASPTTEFDRSGGAVRTAPEGGGYVVVEVGFTGERWMLVTGDARSRSVAPIGSSTP
ncbi:DUF6318 family protein [Isoptericola sp. b441]|uniref:DUF6318 family protein n=1 Tax=Actinotalea lenta TaxID=3064654 RepID=A0ABT9D7F4_9CELL|nr:MULTISPECIES: DUF6318 family protein [unclassified Isoptericola]MDO8106028.1 DUF6318 family protein [Isoptericola sp. b441]MDO8122253.1 DUF6318 family protein [Isoptericola sp. b490]